MWFYLERYLNLYCKIDAYISNVEKKDLFFGHQPSKNKKYHEPIRTVKCKARSALRQRGNRRRA